MENSKKRMNLLKTAPVGTILINCCYQAAYFFVSFILGGISFAGGLSPFATGFTGGASANYIVASALGAASGYAVFFGLTESVRFVGAVVIICLLKLFIQPKAGYAYKTPVILCITGAGTFAVSLCVYLAAGGDGTFLIMCFCESLISSAFALFSSRTEDILREKRKGFFCNPADTVSVFFSGCILLLAVDRFSVYGFSPAKTAAYFAVMLLAFCGKEAVSAITGICCGLTFGFSEAHPQLMPSFILSGLITGVCGSYGKFPVGISLVLSSVLTLILNGNPETALISLSEAVLAAVIFVLLPDKVLSGLSQVIAPATGEYTENGRINTLHFVLKRTAKAIKDISGSVSAVSDFLRKSDKPSYDAIPDAVKEDVCKACNKYEFCWNKCRDISEKSFREANGILIKNEMIITEDLPERLSMICRMPDKIATGFNKAYLEQGARIIAKNDIFEAKKAASRQFACIGALLEATAENIHKLPASTNVHTSALTPLFKDMGFEISGICDYNSPTGKSLLQVYCNRVPVIPDKTLLLEKIYEATGKMYLPPVIDEYTENGTVLSFTEEGKFIVSFHTASHTGAGEQFSGDTLRSFSDGQGYFYAVLSDGMGTGTRAAIDSVMTANLMSRLLRAGFSPENALETVNCAMLIKSAEETLSTLDILKINLETGKAEFYKAGASFSVIGKAEKTVIVEKSSMPLGILENTSFEKSEIDLNTGDTVVILSDGASVIPHKRFKELIKEYKNEGMQALSETIVNEALTLSPSGKHDDITVCCVRIK